MAKPFGFLRIECFKARGALVAIAGSGQRSDGSRTSEWLWFPLEVAPLFGLLKIGGSGAPPQTGMNNGKHGPFSADMIMEM